MPKPLLAAVFLFLILPMVLPSATTFAAPAEGADYRLGIGDELRVQVFEWRSATGDVHEWAALKGEYDVGADGTIAMPLLGPLKASGLTTAQLADAVSTELQSRLNLSIRPQASIDIVQYRPFYISGDVNKPGEYPYRPGLTVLQAISIAGGRYRVNDPGLVLNATGNLQVHRLEYDQLLARRARLSAELNDAGTMTLPPELQRLQANPSTAQLVQREEAIFTAHRDALASETNALNQLKAVLNTEVTSLQGKTKTIDQQLSLMNQELSQTTNLVQKGLAIAPRAYELRQTQLETEGRRLDIDTAILRAREDVAKADQAMVQLHDKTRSQVQTDLAETEQKLRETATRIGTEMMIAGSESALRGNNGGVADDETPAKCLILRKSDGTSKRIEGDENAVVEPGDTIQILRPATSVGTASLDTDTTVAADPPQPESTVRPTPVPAPTPAPAPAPVRHSRELPKRK